MRKYCAPTEEDDGLMHLRKSFPITDPVQQQLSAPINSAKRRLPLLLRAIASVL